MTGIPAKGVHHHRALLGIGVILCMASAAAAAAPPRDLFSYVLFAQTSLRSKGLTATSGAIGVNAGSIYSHGPLLVPSGAIVADEVRIESHSTCAGLFSNNAQNLTPACGPATPFDLPVIANPAVDCGYPAPFPACAPSAPPIEVPAGGQQQLAPGVYGEVSVTGRGTLTLGGGDYVFCSLRVGRNANLLVNGKSNIRVSDDLTLAHGSHTAPNAPGLSAADVRFHVAGNQVRFARNSDVHARLCAPQATLRITAGTDLEGTYLARTIHTEKISGKSAGPGDPCLGNHCGDGERNCQEVCDPAAAPVLCPGTSADGPVQTCKSDCSGFDTQQCPTTTTTTTLPNPCLTPAHCGDGIVNCGETCDPAAGDVPCDGSAGGSFVGDSSSGAFRLCKSDCSGFDDSQCPSSTTSTTAPTTTSTSIAATTTTVTSSTTTTTINPCVISPHCGDGVINCGELCDPNDPGDPTPCGSTQGAFVGDGSPTGGFIVCSADCQQRDDSQCPVTTTTAVVTTTTSTSTTSTSSSTSTTLPICQNLASHCGDGIVNCGEQCDPDSVTQAACGSSGSAAGVFVGCNADCTIDRSFCPGEICGNCIDDDGDGAIDFADDDCCADAHTATMRVRKARIRPASKSSTSSSKFRLRADLGTRPTLTLDPGKQNLVIQLIPSNGGEAFCAQIQSANLKRKGKRAMVFRDPKGQVVSAMGLRRVVVRVNKAGRVRLTARGKRVLLPTPRAGAIRVVAGIPSLEERSANQCSAVTLNFTPIPRVAGVRAP